MKNIKAYLIMLIGVFLLSTSAIFVKLADAPSAIIAFYRLLIAFSFTLFFLLKDKKNISEIKNLNKKNIFLGILSGVFLALHYLFWFESLKYTSVLSSTVIATMQPIFSVIGSYIFFKEKYKVKSILYIFFTIIGSMIIGISDFELGGTELYGDILSFISAIIITFYFLIGQHLRKKISTISYCSLGYLSSTIILFIYSLAKNYSFSGYSNITIYCFFGLAIISTGFGQMVLNWLLKWLNTTTISMGLLTEPIFATIISIIILNESIRSMQIIGFIVVFLGLFLFIKTNSTKK